MSMHIKTGDTVKILSGKDRGKQGKVIAVSPKEGKVIVERLNLVTKHIKPKKMGETGGIVKAEGAMYACKVQIVCPHCHKATRIGHKFIDDKGKQKKVRVCKNKECGKVL